jgi:predicted DNA-binding transcriptional regulator AlpA
MTNNATPGTPGDIDPRHVFLTAKEVILRYGWGRTYGYQMLRSTGFPRRIGDRFRLDSLVAWEQAVLAGELTGRPDDPDFQGGTATTVTSPQPEPEPPAGSAPVGDDVPVAAPTRRRTRGTRRAA